MRPERVGSVVLVLVLAATGSTLAQESKPATPPAAKPPAATQAPVKRAARPVPKPTPTPTPTPTRPEPTPEPKPVDPRPQVAVMAFDYGTLQTQWWGTYDIGTGIADQIVDAFVNDGSFRMIERKKLDTILAEQDFAQSDRAAPDAAKLAKVGKVAGRPLHPGGLDHAVPHLRPPLRRRHRRKLSRRVSSARSAASRSARSSTR